MKKKKKMKKQTKLIVMVSILLILVFAFLILYYDGKITDNINKKEENKIVSVDISEGISFNYEDGTSKKVSDVDPMYLDLDNNKIYAFDYVSGEYNEETGSSLTGKIMVLSMNGEIEKETNVDFFTYLIYAYKNNIYYSDKGSIYKYNIEENKSTKIVSTKYVLSSGSSPNWYLDKANERLYYVKNSALYYADLDGKNQTKISDIQIVNHRGIDFSIYNISYTYNNKAYSYNFKTKESTVIYDGKGTCIMNDDYYICNVYNTSGLYAKDYISLIKIKDGKESNIIVNTGADVVSPIKKISNDKFYYSVLNNYMDETSFVIDGENNTVTSSEYMMGYSSPVQK